MVRDSFATKQLCLKSDKIIIEEVSIKNQPFSIKVTCIYIVKLTSQQNFFEQGRGSRSKKGGGGDLFSTVSPPPERKTLIIK